MQLEDFKKHFILERIELKPADLGRILSIVDFGNVNHWFEDDRMDHLGAALLSEQKLVIDLEKLKEFCDVVSHDARFYYGHDPINEGSMHFIRAARDIFGKHRVITKPIQRVRHHLSDLELSSNTRQTHRDGDGTYIYLPKCNFDVEISIDAVRLMKNYDTLCLFSSDADFVHLAGYLRKQGKKVVLVKGGHIVRQWRDVTHSVINAQVIKEYITNIKQKPG